MGLYNVLIGLTQQIVIWRNHLPSHCRGGYHPPAQYNFPIRYFVGRIRTMQDDEPFNQTRSYPTWREANSLPYRGWVIIRAVKLQFSEVAEQNR